MKKRDRWLSGISNIRMGRSARSRPVGFCQREIVTHDASEIGVGGEEQGEEEYAGILQFYCNFRII